MFAALGVDIAYWSSSLLESLSLQTFQCRPRSGALANERGLSGRIEGSNAPRPDSMQSGLAGPHAVFPMSPDKPDDGGEEKHDDDGVEAMEGGFEDGIGIPGLTEPHSGIGEREAPGPGAKERIDVETKLVHASDSGRQRNKGSDDGQEATEETG